MACTSLVMLKSIHSESTIHWEIINLLFLFLSSSPSPLHSFPLIFYLGKGNKKKRLKREEKFFNNFSSIRTESSLYSNSSWGSGERQCVLGCTVERKLCYSTFLSTIFLLKNPFARGLAMRTCSKKEIWFPYKRAKLERTTAQQQKRQ